ncbi:hypothetical protein D3C81_1096540 [compost metagenome]
MRQLAARAPQVDLEDQRVAPRLRGQHLGQRGVGHQAAVPVVLAIDLHRRKARRQRARSHEMLGAELVAGVVEIGEIARAHIDRAHRHPHQVGAMVDQVEVGEALQRGLQRRGVVETGAAGIGIAHQQLRPAARLEEAALAFDHGARGMQAVEPDAQRLGPALGAVGQPGGRQARQPWLRADMFPERAQLFDAALGRIAGNHRGIERADGNPRDPVRVDPAFGQALVHAGLVGAERAAPLQHQGAHGIGFMRGPVGRLGVLAHRLARTHLRAALGQRIAVAVGLGCFPFRFLRCRRCRLPSCPFLPLFRRHATPPADWRLTPAPDRCSARRIRARAQKPRQTP